LAVFLAAMIGKLLIYWQYFKEFDGRRRTVASGLFCGDDRDNGLILYARFTSGLFAQAAFFGHRLRARAKIISHFRRSCIPPVCVAQARNMLDIPALARLARRAPEHP